MVIPLTRTDGEPQRDAPSAKGLNFKSSPIKDISFKSEKKLPDIVKPFTGLPFLPFSILKPPEESEKSPVMALAPACSPSTEVTYMPSPAATSRSSREPFTGLI